MAGWRERDPAWLNDLRAQGIANFAEQGFPSRRLEEWRYTNVAPIAKGEFELAEPSASPVDVSRAELARHDGPRTVFVDGRLRPDLSSGPYDGRVQVRVVPVRCRTIEYRKGGGPHGPGGDGLMRPTVHDGGDMKAMPVRRRGDADVVRYVERDVRTRSQDQSGTEVVAVVSLGRRWPIREERSLPGTHLEVDERPEQPLGDGKR